MTTDADLREQHDVHRKALADALTGLPGQRWDLSWEQIIDLARQVYSAAEQASRPPRVDTCSYCRMPHQHCHC